MEIPLSTLGVIASGLPAALRFDPPVGLDIPGDDASDDALRVGT